ncbi:MAG TPA: hypothetical protein VE476_10890, partial [Propionibacteriaceae bacterium]|nr:hypothetical protein [Propionibacteriaceae bacterium]
VAVGAGEPARHYEALGDPREPRVQVGTVHDGNQFSRPHPLAAPREVAEATGWSMDRADSDDFVVAECDVCETILPKGCTTPTSRMRWAAGQHVPVEVYRAWQTQRAAELEAAPTAPPPDNPGGGQ